MKRDAEKAQIAQLQRALHWVIRNYVTSKSWVGLRDFRFSVADIKNGVRLGHEDVVFEIVGGHVYWEYAPSHYGCFPVTRFAKSKQALKVIESLSREEKENLIPNLLTELLARAPLQAEDFFRAVETAKLRQVYFDLLKEHAPYTCALLGTVVEAMWVTENYRFRYGADAKDEYDVFRLGFKVPSMQLLATTEQQSIPAYLRETRFDNNGRDFMHPTDLALRDKRLRKAALHRNTLILLQQQLLTWSSQNARARRIAEAHLASIVISSQLGV